MQQICIFAVYSLVYLFAKCCGNEKPSKEPSRLSHWAHVVALSRRTPQRRHVAAALQRGPLRDDGKKCKNQTGFEKGVVKIESNRSSSWQSCFWKRTKELKAVTVDLVGLPIRESPKERKANVGSIKTSTAIQHCSTQIQTPKIINASRAAFWQCRFHCLFFIF